MQSFHSYVALMKLRVVELLIITTVPALFLAAKGWPPIVPTIASLIGGTLAAGAANTFNMVIEAESDKLMSRTKHRPIAAGELTKKQASNFAILLMITSLLIFWYFTTPLATLLTSFAILFYVAIYTVLLKPNTNQNIVWGGIAGCLPVLIGWAAVTNSLAAPAYWFFLVVFFWTPPHFWAIAIKYHDDYEAAKIPMLPVVATKKRVYIEMWFHTILMIASSIMTIRTAQLPIWAYYLTLVLAFAFGEQVYKLRSEESEYEKVAGRIFNFSILYLTLFSLLLVVGQLLS
jgi:protoheme IX farnesyltransferase